MFLPFSGNPCLRRFLKHCLILMAFCLACFLSGDRTAPFMGRPDVPPNQNLTEELVQQASNCTIERKSGDLRYLNISCRMLQQGLVPPAHKFNMIFMLPTLPKHLRRQWNLQVPMDSIVGLEELTAKEEK